MMQYSVRLVVLVLTVIYPFAVYFGVNYTAPRVIAIFLAIILLLRLFIGDSKNRFLILACLFYAGIMAWDNQTLALRFYPVVVNAFMLLIFGTSLIYPPTVIERLARIQKPDLPPSGIIYTRRVTQVWCVFFLLNGSIALVTALWSSFEIWTLYNGLIAYVLIGLLLGGEYWVRLRTQA
ncbi:MAG: hypothetical protein RL563_2852 [Pseudomonadota bacterium]|jgi:uncharacterized membrane protein